MRDVLTVLAALLIVVLAAILAVPPLVDWPAHRALVDRAIARAVGQEARTEGALDIRLLPSPRIRMARLRLGSSAPEAASLDAMYVRAEIALTPLLGGEVRFLDTRIGRAEIKLPTGAGGDWRVPRRLTEDAVLRRAWVFEDLTIQQFLVTTLDPSTGRTDQGYAEAVRIQAGSLAGPWRLEGVAGAVPFEIALGEIAADLSASLKVGAGGGTRPRLDIDAKLDFLPGPDDALIPRAIGTAKLASSQGTSPQGTAPQGAAGPQGPARLPFQAQASLRASGRSAELTNLAVEAGSGATAFRATGEGRYRLDEPRLALSLAGRRFDVAGFAAAQWSALRSVAGGVRAGLPLPVDLALRLDSLAIGGDEDLTAFALALSGEKDRLRVTELDVAGPGRARLRGRAEIALGPSPSGSGTVALEARESDRLGRLLEGAGLPEARALLDGRPVELSADVTAADPIVSLRNLRLVAGETTVTGALRHSAPEGGGRARLEAQLAVQGLDIATLPDGAALLLLGRDLDLGVTLDARNVAYGTAKGGRISGRVATEGAAILVEGLEVRDIAGAEANLAGRISPDGTGRIEGRLVAPRAAPLLDLFGRAWIGGAARLVPAIVRDGAVSLAVVAERVTAPGSGGPTFRTALRGRLAGGDFDATTLSSDGALREITARAETDRSETWLGGAAASAGGRPGRVVLTGRRDAGGSLLVEGEGEVAGVTVRTLRPLAIGGDDDRLESGEAEIASADAARWLPLLGIPGAGPVPLALRAVLSRADAARLALTGRVAGSDLAADLSQRPSGEIDGTMTLGRLSLPWLAETFALGPVTAPPAGSSWGTARFGARPTPAFGGTVRVAATLLDLGGGRTGRDATFTLATRPDGFRIDDAALALGEGRLSGAFTLDRQGGLASLIGEASYRGAALSDILGAPFGPGRLDLALRFGASGESPAGLIGTLGGAGEVAIETARIASADPSAVERVAGRVLRSDDPLGSQRWAALLGDELGRAPLGADRIVAAGSLVGGALRLGPVRIEQPAGAWLGTATVDLRALTLDMRGVLQAATSPRGWTGPPPAIGLGWAGPLARPVRTIDPSPLINGLAGAVLARELDRIETFELDAAERGRQNSRAEMDRQRRIALEEARQARLREEAAERAREAAERARETAERAREAADRTRELERAREAERARDGERRRQEGERRALDAPPLDIRPPAQSGERRPE